MKKNTRITYNIQPQKIKYLEETDECQKEPYYECIASQLDVMEFNECSNKCIPNTFSNLGRNYSTPFCQDDTDNEYCALEIVVKINDQEIASDCKKSCSNLEYVGELAQNMPVKGKKWNQYHLQYRLTNHDFELMVYEEYFIYDTNGLIGSVGGTLGAYQK